MNSILEMKQLKILKFLEIAEKIEGKTKFQKMIFLGKREYGLDVGYTFEKYNYGPYSEELSRNLESLIDLGFIAVKEEIFDTEGHFPGVKNTYFITERGEKVLDREIFNEEETTKVNKILTRWNNKSYKEIIDYVYSKYMNK